MNKHELFAFSSGSLGVSTVQNQPERPQEKKVSPFSHSVFSGKPQAKQKLKVEHKFQLIIGRQQPKAKANTLPGLSPTFK